MRSRWAAALVALVAAALVSPLLAAGTYADDRQTSTLTLESQVPTQLEMDEPLDLSGRLMIGDEPAADRSLTVRLGWQAPRIVVTEHTVTTDAVGRFRFSSPPGRAGRYSVAVLYAGDEQSLATSTLGEVEVLAIPTTLRLAVPTTPVTSGSVVDLHGSLVDEEGRPVSGADVLLRVTVSTRSEDHVTTDENGRFDLPVAVDWVGEHMASAWFVGDGRYGESLDTGRRWKVVARPGQLTVNAPERVLIGEPIRISGTLTDDTGVGDKGSRVYFGYPDSDVNDGGEDEAYAAADGSFSFVHPPQVWVGGIGFEIEAPHPIRVTPQKSNVVVHVVAPTLRSRVLGGDAGRRHGVLRQGDDTGILTRVAPRRSGLCLRFQVDRLREGRWRRQAASGCRRTDQTARAFFELPGRRASGHYRVRPVWRSVAGPTRGRWVRLRVR